VEACVVFDNRAFAPEFIAGWGLSVFFRPLGLLFDTGSETNALLHNFSLFNIMPREIHSIFLSHFHWDHAGGLLGLLPLLSSPRVFLHRGFSAGFISEIRRLGGEVVILDEPSEIGPKIFSTGPLPAPTPEAALILEIRGRLALFTGCAHPGITNLVRQTLELFGKPPLLVAGGFHLLQTSRKKARLIAEELLALGVRLAAPCHCTGQKALEAFADIFQDGFLATGTGSILPLEELLQAL